MSYYEVIYETGAHSVVSGDSDKEVLKGIREQHQRAVNGQDGGPAGHPAERVKTVLKYDKHPGDFGAEGTVTKEVLGTELSTLKTGLSDENGVVNVEEFAAGVRAISSPVDHGALAESRHASMFKAKEVETLDPKGWE